ncbi:MAG: c-type cytochrome [Paracoccaceae bacterium]
METPNLSSKKSCGGARRRMLAALAMAAAVSVASQGAAQSVDGKTVYKDANCVGCHKWHGQGGGGYGGAALSLREMGLDREQLIEVIVCGRMETRMPYHLRAAWKTDTPCYGMTAAEIGNEIPPMAANFLRDHQIEAVADYVIAHMQGRGEPTKEECVEFWGEASRECDRY